MKSPWFELKMSLVGIIIAAVGAISNLRVEAVNGGVMPVFMDACLGFEEARLDAFHSCGMAATHLAGLADWIRIGSSIYSPGDLLLALGQAITIITAISFLGLMVQRKIKSKV